MTELPPRFQDGKQGISHDRILMRVKDYIQIGTTIGAIFWGGVQIIRKLDAVDRRLDEIPILQRQISSLQQMVANSPMKQKKHKVETDTGDE